MLYDTAVNRRGLNVHGYCLRTWQQVLRVLAICWFWLLYHLSVFVNSTPWRWMWAAELKCRVFSDCNCSWARVILQLCLWVKTLREKASGTSELTAIRTESCRCLYEKHTSVVCSQLRHWLNPCDSSRFRYGWPLCSSNFNDFLIHKINPIQNHPTL